MPYVAHKRLVTVIHIPYHTVYYGGTLIPIRVHSRVRPSVLAAELNRIRSLTRPSTESYVEKYLQSKDHIVSLPKISPPISLFRRKEKKEKKRERGKTIASFTAIKHECRHHHHRHYHHHHHPCRRDTSESSNHSSHLFTITTPCFFDDIWHHRSAESRRLFYTDKHFLYFYHIYLSSSRIYIYTYIYIDICNIILSIENLSRSLEACLKLLKFVNLSHLVTPRLYFFFFDRFNRITKRSLLLANTNSCLRNRARTFARIFYVSLFTVLRRRGEGNTCESGFPSPTSTHLRPTSRGKVYLTVLFAWENANKTRPFFLSVSPHPIISIHIRPVTLGNAKRLFLATSPKK